MRDLATLSIDFTVLDWQGDARASLPPGAASHPEQVAACLMRVIRSAAEPSDGQTVEPVSVTLDTTAKISAGSATQLTAEIDRRTRTMVFAHGNARQGETTVITATAVYRVSPAE